MGKKEKLKQDKNRLARLSNDSITIEAFLSRVLGIRDQRVLAGRISHKDLKSLFPDLRRASFDFIIDNPGTVYNGEVYLVSDGFGSVVPYYNPMYVYEETEYFGEYEQPVATVVDVPIVDEIDLKSKSTYELQELLHLYQERNMRGAYRKVHEELTGRKDSHHASQESKGKAYKKERKNKRLEDDF